MSKLEMQKAATRPYRFEHVLNYRDRIELRSLGQLPTDQTLHSALMIPGGRWLVTSSSIPSQILVQVWEIEPEFQLAASHAFGSDAHMGLGPMLVQADNDEVGFIIALPANLQDHKT